MATVPPADRTSPSLDPRYDPRFQRGYASERPVERRTSAPRREEHPLAPRGVVSQSGESRPVASDPAPPAAEQDPVPEPVGAEQSVAEIVPTSRPRRGVLWLVSAALVVAGVLLHFTFGPAGYGADWSVSTEEGVIRFADGRTIQQVLATQLAVTLAPYLVVLGIATAVATLFLQILRSERGTR